MSGSYRAFCAYGPHYREPGCGWEQYANTETEAKRLADEHAKGQTHAADYERVNRNTDRGRQEVNIEP